jgi:hypothetical protein
VTLGRTEQVAQTLGHDLASEPLADISDTELRGAIRTLFAQAQTLIDKGRVQAVILAARRLACVYQLLVESGQPELHGAVILSDRLMDLALSADIRGVLILDDSVVLGTTLARLTEEVRQHCPQAEVLVRCVVVDRQQRVGFLVEELGLQALEERDTGEVRQFSADLARCLFRRQVPFFSDFPVSGRFRVSRERWLEHLCQPQWLVADVTPPILEGGALQAFAQVPDEGLRSNVLSRLPPELAELVDAFKIRSYTRTDADDFEIVLVPLALLAPATLETIEACMFAVTRDSAPDAEVWSAWDARTRQRYLQYYASVCILADYWRLFRGVEALVAEDMEALLAPVPLRLLFGELAEQLRPALIKAALEFTTLPAGSHPQPVQLRYERPRPSKLLNQPRIQELLFATREMLDGIGIPPRPDIGTLTKVGLVFAHAISSIFGYVDDTVEAEQRRQIQALPDHKAYDDWLTSSGGRVLDQGLTLSELTRALVPESMASDAWARSLVAFGIDIGNDLGIIVPVTQVDDDRGIVYRCYRLGETAFIAGRPLPFLIGQGSPLLTEDLDAMCTSAIQGYPVQPTVTAIEQLTSDTTRSDTFGSEIELDRLRATLRDAVPGTLVEGWNGVVTDLIGVDLFEADLRPVHDTKAVLARLPRNWLTETERNDVRAGQRLVWSVWERERGGSKTRSSKLRLLPVAPVDLEHARAAGERVSQMLQDDDK